MPAPLTIRTLEASDFEKLYECFMLGFSDYFISFRMTREQFGRKLVRDGTDLRLTAAAFEGDKMLGFVMHGAGIWNGLLTAYNGGTAVIPEARGQKLVSRIYDFIVPVLKEKGIKQALLEVLEPNKKALRIYEMLGYMKTRRFEYLKAEKAKVLRLTNVKKEVQVRPAGLPDWTAYHSCWEFKPSWPCSADAVRRSTDRKCILEARVDDKIVGYGVMFTETGSIVQIAVKPQFRNQGIGTAIMKAIAETTDSPVLSMINIDDKAEATLGFLHKLGFEKSFAQFEMEKKIV